MIVNIFWQNSGQVVLGPAGVPCFAAGSHCSHYHIAVSSPHLGSTSTNTLHAELPGLDMYFINQLLMDSGNFSRLHKEIRNMTI